MIKRSFFVKGQWSLFGDRFFKEKMFQEAHGDTKKM